MRIDNDFDPADRLNCELCNNAPDSIIATTDQMNDETSFICDKCIELCIKRLIFDGANFMIDNMISEYGLSDDDTDYLPAAMRIMTAATYALTESIDNDDAMHDFFIKIISCKSPYHNDESIKCIHDEPIDFHSPIFDLGYDYINCPHDS